MFDDDALLPISALQHYLFCPRQCALIHLEQVWSDNFFTAAGNIMHERVHEEGEERRPGVVIEKGMPLRSLTLGLIGKTDVVEYHDSGEIIPVEYKRGKPKLDAMDEIQLCAQALCLEEMLGRDIRCGYLYYGKPRRRTEVVFDDEHRKATKDTIESVRVLLDSGKTPAPLWRKKRCISCSLVEHCFPERMALAESVQKYIMRNLAQSKGEDA